MSNRTDIKIFIASSGELEAERKESIIVLADLNKRYPHLHLEPVLFEIDTPSGNFPWKKRVQDGINPLLEEAHIVVVLFYSKAGEFTREEFELATSQQKKVYLYLKEGFAPRNTEEAKKYFEVLELKEKIEKESALRYQPYKILTDYYNLFYRDLEKYIDATYPAPANAPVVTVSTSRQHIPVAPRPYLAHPYSIMKNFTGRKEEMTRLTEWYKYDKEPMCIVEAIGGMGKSSLCWKWLQDDILTTDTKVDGIIWWSFYDQGFEEFIHHAYEYCMPENIRNKQQQIDETTEVIKAITNHRFLLVLDGFERVLRGYAQMMSMYIQEEGLSKKNIKDINQAFDIQQRTPVTPKAEKVLRALCAGNSKALMTTRLYPATIEGLAGVKHIKLTGLSKTDTIIFFKTEGIVGTDEEMIQAGEVYGFHPLMLKLLSTAIKRSFTKDIKMALSDAFSKGLIDQNGPQKILATSYNLLNKQEQSVVATLSVFRTAFAFDAAQALFPAMQGEKLEEIMIELCNLGFLLYNDQQRIFDFHPILRSYLYNGLTGKDIIHELAIGYFTALHVKEKVITISDLEPIIEQLHHLIRARKYKQAFGLYLDRLSKPLFYQLSQYELCVSLCKQLLPDSSELLSQLHKNDRSFLLNELSLSYASIGQLDKATKSFMNTTLNILEDNNEKNLAYVLCNFADVVFIPSGKLSLGMIYCFKSCLMIDDDEQFISILQNSKLACILTIRGCYSSINDEPAANSFLHKTEEYGKKKYLISSRIICGIEYTIWSLSQINFNSNRYLLQSEALNWSLETIKYADEFRTSNYSNLYNFLISYEALSRSLLAVFQTKDPLPIISESIFFYDEHFQQIIDNVIPNSHNYLTLIERCLSDGLTLARRINEVFKETIFSLLFAKLEWQKFLDNPMNLSHFNDSEKWINETYLLAERIGYRILLTDFHLFCAEVQIELKQLKHDDKKLLNLSAKEHIQKAREYAKDTSTIEDLFMPPDGSADEFYKDIPEYEMLKRGMTEDERIKKGYYAAWLRADKLEERLN